MHAVHDTVLVNLSISLPVCHTWYCSYMNALVIKLFSTVS